MFIGNNLSKKNCNYLAKSFLKQFFIFVWEDICKQGYFKAHYWMKPQWKCHNPPLPPPPVKIVKYRLLFPKRNALSLFPARKCSKSHNYSMICIVT